MKGITRIESELADWPYEKAEGEPLTGYQPLTEIRGAVGALVNASADEIALTQNATMGMNLLGQGLDLASGDEVVSTDQGTAAASQSGACWPNGAASSSKNCRSSRRWPAARKLSSACSPTR